MSDMAEGFISGGFVFYNNFDSANLAKVIQVDINAINDNGNSIFWIHEFLHVSHYLLFKLIN